MKKLKLFFVATLLCTVFTSYAQEEVRVFKTQEYTQNFVITEPNYFHKKSRIEKGYKEFLKNGEASDVSVNLIFHNLYSANNEMISRPVIERQIEILNEHFSNAEYPDPVPSEYHEKFENRFCKDTKINFCLVTQQTLDVQGEPYNPINYVQVSNSDWAINNDMKSAVGGHPVVLSRMLINVWIVNLEENAAGFSQVPGGNWDFDGIVIDYQLLKNIDAPVSVSRYNEGKSLTHLVANYFNVNDLWNENIRCGDDGVRDTPIHNAPNYTCYGSLHMTTCEKKPSVEMLNNFMDATPDACQSYFTSGQMMRMQSTLATDGVRYNLTTFGCGEHFSSEAAASSRRAFDDKDFVIFPNPTNGQFNVEFYGLPKSTSGIISIVDINGKSILNKPVSDISQIFSFNINSEHINQLYFVKFRSNQGETIINKLIINQ